MFTIKVNKVKKKEENICTIQKKVVPLQAERLKQQKLTQMEAVRETSYSNVLNMAFMLPVLEQQRLIKDVQAHMNRIPVEENLRPYTWEELRARVRESEEQIARGEVYSQEESDRMFDEYLKTELGVAV